jgi:hypothetical protein
MPGVPSVQRTARRPRRARTGSQMPGSMVPGRLAPRMSPGNYEEYKGDLRGIERDLTICYFMYIYIYCDGQQ